MSALLLILTLSYSSIASAISSSIRFNHLTSENGLPQNSVLTIVRDKLGFLWIGTEDGLARYDGYDLKVFKHQDNNISSLSYNYISIIEEDSQGGLWIGTLGGGLNHFNIKTEQFTHYRHQANDPNSLSNDIILSLKEDSQGNLWIGTSTGGLNHFNTKNKQFTHYRHQAGNPNSLSPGKVLSITEDSRGYLWIGTQNSGLDRFNTKTKQITHFRHKADDPNSLSSDKVRSILEDKQGNLWIATQGGGLNYFNINTEQFTHYRHQDNDQNSLSSDKVVRIIESSQGGLWLGTGGGGLNYFNTKTKQFTHYQHQAADLHSLSNNNILSILEDSQGELWVGTYGGGLNHFNIKINQFAHYRHQVNDPNSLNNSTIISINEDSKGDLWIGTRGGGLNHFNIKTKQFSHYLHLKNDSNSLSNNNVFSISEDSQGNLWLGTFGGGLNYFNTKTKQFSHYRHLANDSNSLSSDNVISITKDNQGNLWIGTFGGGLNYFNTKTKQFTHYRHQANDPNSLSKNIVISILKDSQGNIWAGTKGGGLNYLNIKTKQFTHYRHQVDDPKSLSNNSIFSIIEDSKGSIWVGTQGGGLNHLNKETGESSHYNTKNGLPNNVIYRIEEDNQGYLWVSTNHGLSRMNPKTETFRNYDSGDGLQSNEFNAGASLKSKSGELFFGGINGFNRFYPEKITDDIQPPKVVITDMLLLNKSVPIFPANNQAIDIKNKSLTTENQVTKKNTAFSLTQAIYLTKSITLTHKDNIIAFEFAALDLSNPKKNQFAYQLIGWDKNWVSTNYKNRKATYTNLPDGDYIFRVKASNTDGYWNEEGVSLQITILPPPWKTWWAYTLYGLFLLSIVLTFIRSQRNKLIFERELNAQLESKVRERTSQLQSKSDELQKSNIMLEQISLTDQLTGLKNRHFMINNIESDIALVLRKYKSNLESKDKQEEADLIFFMIDLDHFKMVNDIHGHAAGDAVLIQIKAILEQIFRETDYLIRWGGEEFLIIARFTKRSNAPKLAERLRKTVENYDFSISESSTGENKVLKKTCSIGFACYPFCTEDTEALTWTQVIDVADHCMYAAKKSRRNSWVGLYNKTNNHGDDLFTAVIEQTQSLIQSEELKIISSITEVDQVYWSTGELTSV